MRILFPAVALLAAGCSPAADQRQADDAAANAGAIVINQASPEPPPRPLSDEQDGR